MADRNLELYYWVVEKGMNKGRVGLLYGLTGARVGQIVAQIKQLVSADELSTEA